MKDKITIYTDGAARGNPGKAGWGAIVMFSPPDKGEYPKGEGVRIVELGGHSTHATNNQMELRAPIEALKYVSKMSFHKEMSIEIFSDSKYVILGITDWVYNWMKNNWRNAAKKPVLNRELWEELYRLSKEFKPKWNYVEGHSGDKYNERADVIATSFADDEQVI